MSTLTGVELIAKERLEQLERHGRTNEYDVNFNVENQLSLMASYLCTPDYMGCGNVEPPAGWDEDHFERMMSKPYKERLIIAGALIAAELDRIENS